MHAELRQKLRQKFGRGLLVGNGKKRKVEPEVNNDTSGETVQEEKQFNIKKGGCGGAMHLY